MGHLLDLGPRLTTTLLGALIFVAYLVLRGGTGTGEAQKRFSAALAVMGACVMPVIHYSVQLWRGQHPTVITSRAAGLAPQMAQTLTLSFLAFTLLAAVLLTLRSRVVLQRAKLEGAAYRRGLPRTVRRRGGVVMSARNSRRVYS